MLPLGLVSWMMVGLVGGGLGRAFLPGEPQMGWLSALGSASFGALAGGILASLLEFGGIAAYDPRSMTVAALSAMLALVATRFATLADAH